MSARSIIIVLVAMCGSFTTILAFMGHFYATPPGAGSRVRPPPTRSEVLAESFPWHPPGGPGLLDGGDRPDIPSTPSPLPDTVDGEAAAEEAATPTDPKVDRMARVARSRLARVEQALWRQVAALKKSRDELLDEFAERLAGVSVSQAAQELSLLDDETAGMALERLGPARRKAILRALPERRRTALQRRLGLAAR